ncbi:hypothetical protein SLI_6497 [Streptomyces lividans 1326]|uniref:Uncharacterized protein n=1 Tax=Streptomyces lividans 1326 TaxID=1200984 RepID=A0A7U9HEE4_STRLI|nr:hypothetical protein SLI_6497 [Streptomyces lividans 1326]
MPGRPLALAAVTAHLAARGRGSGLRRSGGHGVTRPLETGGNGSDLRAWRMALRGHT